MPRPIIYEDVDKEECNSDDCQQALDKEYADSPLLTCPDNADKTKQLEPDNNDGAKTFDSLRHSNSESCNVIQGREVNSDRAHDGVHAYAPEVHDAILDVCMSSDRKSHDIIAPNSVETSCDNSVLNQVGSAPKIINESGQGRDLVAEECKERSSRTQETPNCGISTQATLLENTDLPILDNKINSSDSSHNGVVDPSSALHSRCISEVEPGLLQTTLFTYKQSSVVGEAKREQCGNAILEQESGLSDLKYDEAAHCDIEKDELIVSNQEELEQEHESRWSNDTTREQRASVILEQESELSYQKFDEAVLSDIEKDDLIILNHGELEQEDESRWSNEAAREQRGSVILEQESELSYQKFDEATHSDTEKDDLIVSNQAELERGDESRWSNEAAEVEDCDPVETEDGYKDSRPPPESIDNDPVEDGCKDPRPSPENVSLKFDEVAHSAIAKNELIISNQGELGQGDGSRWRNEALEVDDDEPVKIKDGCKDPLPPPEGDAQNVSLDGHREGVILAEGNGKNAGCAVIRCHAVLLKIRNAQPLYFQSVLRKGGTGILGKPNVTSKFVTAGALTDKSDALTDKSDALTVKSDALTDKSDALTDKSDALTDKSDALTDKSDALTDKSDALTDKSDALTDKSDALTDKSDALTDKSHALTDKSHALTDKSDALTDKSDALADKSHALTDKSDALTDKSDALTDKSHALTVKSDALTDKSDALTDKSDALTDKSDALTVKSDALTDKSDALTDKSDALTDKSDALTDKSHALTGKSHALTVKSDALTDKSHALTDNEAAEVDDTDPVVAEDGCKDSRLPPKGDAQNVSLNGNRGGAILVEGNEKNAGCAVIRCHAVLLKIRNAQPLYIQSVLRKEGTGILGCPEVRFKLLHIFQSVEAKQEISMKVWQEGVFSHGLKHFLEIFRFMGVEEGNLWREMALKNLGNGNLKREMKSFTIIYDWRREFNYTPFWRNRATHHTSNLGETAAPSADNVSLAYSSLTGQIRKKLIQGLWKNIVLIASARSRLVGIKELLEDGEYGLKRGCEGHFSRIRTTPHISNLGETAGSSADNVSLANSGLFKPGQTRNKIIHGLFKNVILDASARSLLVGIKELLEDGKYGFKRGCEGRYLENVTLMNLEENFSDKDYVLGGAMKTEFVYLFALTGTPAIMKTLLNFEIIKGTQHRSITGQEFDLKTSIKPTLTIEDKPSGDGPGVIHATKARTDNPEQTTIEDESRGDDPGTIPAVKTGTDDNQDNNKCIPMEEYVNDWKGTKTHDIFSLEHMYYDTLTADIYSILENRVSTKNGQPPDQSTDNSMRDEHSRRCSFRGRRNRFFNADDFSQAGFFCHVGNVIECYSCHSQHGIEEILSRPSSNRYHNQGCRHLLNIRSRRSEFGLIEADGRVSDDIADPPGQQSLYVPPGDIRRESYRLSTFEHFPVTCSISRKSLAKSGFFFTGFYDRVKCFACARTVERWEETDNPAELKWHKQNCPFPKGQECGNVSLPKLFQAITPVPAAGSPSSASQSANQTNNQGEQILEQRDPNTGAIIRRVRYPADLPERIRQTGGTFEIGPNNEVIIQSGPGPGQRNPANVGLQATQQQPRRQWRMANVISADHKRFLTNLYLNRELDRLASFARWPTGRPNIAPAYLAKTGFFYLGDMDRTQCFSCGGVLRNWNLEDDAEAEHRTHFPQCRMVVNTEPRNIPVHENPETEEEKARKYPCRFPANPHMRSENARLETFDRRWPMGKTAATPAEIAQGGFFFLGDRDRAKCWYCNGGLQNWEYDDIPWIEHAKWFPNCQFLLKVKGQHFVYRHLALNPHLARPIIARQDGSPLESVGAQPTATPGGQPRPQRSHDIPPSEPRVNQPQATPVIIDPQAEMRKRKERVQNIMKNSDLVKNVLAMGFDDKIVSSLLEDRIISGNETNPDDVYESASQLLEDVFKKEEEIKRVVEERRNQIAGAVATPLPSLPGPGSFGIASSMYSGVSGASGMSSLGPAPGSGKYNVSYFGDDDDEEMEQDMYGSLEGSSTSVTNVTAAKRLLGAEENRESLQEALNKIEEERMCKICFTNQADMVFKPCAHMCCCMECTQAITQCPVCRKRIEQAIKTYTN